MTYTREQLDALRIRLHEMAEYARHLRSVQPAAYYSYYEGQYSAYTLAASRVLALIESEEEVPA